MPAIVINGPDKTKVKINMPDGYSPEDATTAAYQAFHMKPSPTGITPTQSSILSNWMKKENTPVPTVIKGDKGKTRFGINSVANPDVNLDTLDEVSARKLLIDRYWDKAGIDSLPADAQEMGFNFAGVAGVGTAKRIIAASKGDKARLRTLIFRHFDNVIAKNPEKARNRKGWVNRFSLY